jgi:hypothetical protein
LCVCVWMLRKTSLNGFGVATSGHRQSIGQWRPTERLLRARLFPNPAPTWLRHANLVNQFPFPFFLSSHQQTFALSQRTALLLRMLLSPVAPQLEPFLNSVPFPRPRPRPRRPLLENAVSTVPLLANAQEDGPRGGSQIYDPVHRTDWRIDESRPAVVSPDLQPSRYPPHQPLPRLLFLERAASPGFVLGYALFLNP